MHKNKFEFTFGKRASAYDEGYEGRLSQRFYNILYDNVELKNDYKVLDVGCGTGELLKRLSQKGMFDGFGIDSDEKMLEIAKKKCPEMKIEVSKSDNMPFSNDSFDVITACMAYHHFDNRIGFIKEAARILKSGGKLYIADPNFYSILRKACNKVLKHINAVGYFSDSKELFADFASNGFKPITCVKNGFAQLFILEKI